MTLREEALNILEHLPEDKLKALIYYARYLNEQYQTAEDVKPVRHGEWVDGEIWMSEDFNEPMEFIAEDEMRVLEAMRENKKLEAAI